MVGGRGPQPTFAMVIGEAPSPKDDEAGEPFSDDAGRLLETALRSVGVAPETVYMTNVVKTVPLNDVGLIRRPTKEEVAEWASILDGEIQATAPAAILALGHTAVRALTGIAVLVPAGSKIGNVYTAWHPAKVAGSMRAEWTTQIEPWAEAVLGQ